MPNKIRFTHLCARKSLGVDQKVLTKITSGFITSEASADGTATVSSEPFLHLGAKISLRFSDLRNDEMMEFGGKSSLGLGDERKR